MTPDVLGLPCSARAGLSEVNWLAGRRLDLGLSGLNAAGACNDLGAADAPSTAKTGDGNTCGRPISSAANDPFAFAGERRAVHITGTHERDCRCAKCYCWGFLIAAASNDHHGSEQAKEQRQQMTTLGG